MRTRIICALAFAVAIFLPAYYTSYVIHDYSRTATFFCMFPAIMASPLLRKAISNKW